MKPYGKPREDTANRNVPGTSRPCPCCGRHKAPADRKRTARQKARIEIKEQEKEIE